LGLEGSKAKRSRLEEGYLHFFFCLIIVYSLSLFLFLIIVYLITIKLVVSHSVIVHVYVHFVFRWIACMPGEGELDEFVWLLAKYSESESPTMASGGGVGGRPAPMPRGGKPALSPRPQPQQNPHSQLAGRSMATLAADAAASVAQTHAHRGHGGQMNDARAKTVLKEAVDAVVNSFAKHTHGYGRGILSNTVYYIIINTSLY
jgi:hypothetical protein